MWQKAKNSDVFSEAERWHKNPVASLGYARNNKSIIYITTHKQKSTHLPIIPQQSIKKAASCDLQTYKQTSGLL